MGTKGTKKSNENGEKKKRHDKKMAQTTLTTKRKGKKPTIPFLVAPSSHERLMAFCALPARRQKAIKKLSAERKKQSVPAGPYPYKDKVYGWVLAWFNDPRVKLGWITNGTPFLDVALFSTKTSARWGLKTSVSFRQEVWDKEDRKLVLGDGEWHKGLVPPVCVNIIRNEHKNWKLYNESMQQYEDKELKKTAANEIVTLSRGVRSRGLVGTAKKRVVKRKITFNKDAKDADGVKKKRSKSKKEQAAMKAAKIKREKQREQLELFNLEYGKAVSLLEKSRRTIREVSDLVHKMKSNDEWLLLKQDPQELLATVSTCVTDPVVLRSMISRLAAYATPLFLKQLAEQFRSKALVDVSKTFVEHNARFNELVKEKDTLMASKPAEVDDGKNVILCGLDQNDPAFVLRVPITPVGTTDTKPVVTTGTKPVGTTGTKPVGTKPVGTKPVGTKRGQDRHASWPDTFTPKPHYVRSRNSKTGFMGVSIDTRRGSAYRVKVRNVTIYRGFDLHEACEVFYNEKSLLYKQAAASKNKTPLDALTFQ